MTASNRRTELRRRIHFGRRGLGSDESIPRSQEFGGDKDHSDGDRTQGNCDENTRPQSGLDRTSHDRTTATAAPRGAVYTRADRETKVSSLAATSCESWRSLTTSLKLDRLIPNETRRPPASVAEEDAGERAKPGGADLRRQHQARQGCRTDPPGASEAGEAARRCRTPRRARAINRRDDGAKGATFPFSSATAPRGRLRAGGIVRPDTPESTARGRNPLSADGSNRGTMTTPIYQDGTYRTLHPRWHSERASWKAQQVTDGFEQWGITPTSICDIGCGTGDILRVVTEQTSTVDHRGRLRAERRRACRSTKTRWRRFGSCVRLTTSAMKPHLTSPWCSTSSNTSLTTVGSSIDRSCRQDVRLPCSTGSERLHGPHRTARSKSSKPPATSTISRSERRSNRSKEQGTRSLTRTTRSRVGRVRGSWPRAGALNLARRAIYQGQPNSD